jgi:putative tryptophan/tyrosine transport system substrate-binding protein
LGGIQVVAPSFGVELRLVDVRDAREIETAISAFAHEPDGTLVVLTSPFAMPRSDCGVGGSSSSAGNLSLPFVRSGRRLISYGPDLVEQYRQAAGYIDCEKPANLPVHPSTKFELVINLKTPLRHSSSKCR